MSVAQAADPGKADKRTSLLYRIGTQEITKTWLQSLQLDVRRALSDVKIAHKGALIEKNQVVVNLRDASKMDAALLRLKKLATPIPGSLFSWNSSLDLAIDGKDGVIIIGPTAPGLERRLEAAMTRTIEITRLRIDPAVTAEATIEAQGRDRVLIRVPEPASAEVKARVSMAAKLTFHLVDISMTPEQAQTGGVPPDDLLLPSADNPAQSFLIHKEPIISGDDLANAQASYRERSGGRAEVGVHFEFNGRGAATFARVTRENIGKPFAIVLDNKVISAPVIRTGIPGGRGQITGGFGLEEANRIALLLRSGALPATLSLIEERSGEP